GPTIGAFAEDIARPGPSAWSRARTGDRYSSKMRGSDQNARPTTRRGGTQASIPDVPVGDTQYLPILRRLVLCPTVRRAVRSVRAICARELAVGWSMSA